MLCAISRSTSCLLVIARCNPTLFDVVFLDHEVNDYRDVVKADADKNLRFNKLLRDKGILKSPGKIYPSFALTDHDLDQIASAVAYAAANLD